MNHNHVLQRIRSVIFGMEDGLVSMWGLVVGVSVGSHSSGAVILAGLAGAVPAALSMAAGEYLSSKAKREVQNAAILRIERLVTNNKKAALKRLERHYKKEGFSEKQAKAIVKLIKSKKHQIVQQLVEEEGNVETVLENPGSNSLFMFTSFMLASLFPITPFMLFEIPSAQTVSFLLTGMLLFGIGATKTRVTKTNWLRSGLEMLFIGGLAGISGYLIGGFFA